MHDLHDIVIMCEYNIKLKYRPDYVINIIYICNKYGINIDQTLNKFPNLNT